MNGGRIASAVVCALVLAGCGTFAPNYSGRGNEFVVTGRVTYVGSQSLGADIYDITEAHGAADGWFTDGRYHVLHDNCDCHGAWYGRKKFGHVTADGRDGEIPLSDVEVGACIEFTGKIRASQQGKTHVDRPVYDVARVIPCEAQS